MRSLSGLTLWAALLLLAGWAGWRMLAASMATHWAPTDPERALRWNPIDPSARLSIAQTRLEAGELHVAEALSRDVLRSFPLRSRALVILAQAADAARLPHTDSLFQIALRRAPRSQYVHVWVIGELMRTGRYDQALTGVTTLLQFAPRLAEDLIAVLVDASDEPAFASAIASELAHHPGWRTTYLSRLIAAGHPEPIDAVFGELLFQRDLPDAEARLWFNWLEQVGLWGKAYSHWVSWLNLPPGSSVALVHNGGFETPPTGVGFDWRMQNSPAVLIERVTEGSGSIVRVGFLGRRAAQIHLSQKLLLAPGRYRLELRAAARALHSDAGIQWRLRCLRDGPMLGATDPFKGSFEWKQAALDFEVPARDCPAQELALINPGAAGAGKIVSGSLWMDDVSIRPIPARPISDPPLPAGSPQEER